MVLTPHDREFARIATAGHLAGRRPAGGGARAGEAAARVVLLKGNATVVAAPDGRALVNPASSSWLATPAPATCCPA